MIEKLNIDEFIKLTKKDPLKWIEYCEIVILRSGRIAITYPCHTETCVKLAMEFENKAREEIEDEIPDNCLPLEWIVDKHSLVAVWYNGYMYPSGGLNRFQKRTIRMLQEYGLILKDKDAYIQPATEYRNYLLRKRREIQ